METEENSQIPFLDIMVKKENNNIDLSIYRKPTYTGLGVNFLSKCYECFKINTFNTMFFRAYKLSSSYANFHHEIEFLKNFFTNNGFTLNIFYKNLRKFLNNTISPSPPKFGPKKMKPYFRFPYLNDETNKYLKSEINKLCNKYCPQVSPQLTFFNNNKLKQFVNHKETLPKKFDSLVVYEFVCPSCQLAYISSTKKTIYSRYHEHKGTSNRTGRSLTRPLYSTIREHCENMCKCSFSLDNFSVLYRGSKEVEIRIAESIQIKFRKPQLNQDTTSYTLKFV